MKITKSQLRRIIKEELKRVLNEGRPLQAGALHRTLNSLASISRPNKPEELKRAAEDGRSPLIQLLLSRKFSVYNFLGLAQAILRGVLQEVERDLKRKLPYKFSLSDQGFGPSFGQGKLLGYTFALDPEIAVDPAQYPKSLAKDIETINKMIHTKWADEIVARNKDISAGLGKGAAFDDIALDVKKALLGDFFGSTPDSDPNLTRG